MSRADSLELPFHSCSIQHVAAGPQLLVKFGQWIEHAGRRALHGCIIGF